MKYPRLLVILPVLAAFATLVVGAQAEGTGISGTWRVSQVKPSGVTLRTYLTLKQDGDKITGTVLLNTVASLAIRLGHMDGADAVFRVDWGWNFRVRPEGTNLHVTVTYDSGGTEESTAVRSDLSEVALAAPAPLPALRELPANGMALTPPMGWNSWNHFAERVDDMVVRETADKMVSSGMAAAGYVYVNIDDTWELGRDADGNIVPNKKFPDMRALADYVHSKGLKIGIYTSPGPLTCGGYEGSYGHEEQDARTYASWGIDYLKYDWCSAGRLYPNSGLRASYQKMGEALLKCGRPIVYSLCEYGSEEVWTWGPKVAGNLWRTTGDIQDNWKSMSQIGFNQGRLAPYAAPGHWNDPDMLEVGNGGMTPTEYRTHISLWSMLAAPLMAGNDLRTMTADTRDILTNREVIALDQDHQGSEATRLSERDGVEIWVKPLSGGAEAVAIFNRNEAERSAWFAWTQVGRQEKPTGLRDLWMHMDVIPGDTGYSGSIPGHGVILLRLAGGPVAAH
ncbi:MAG TPA: glycoside hydrolase family 27 protein [Opitutaceae bacterium]|jgi:alpha-galactosidase|nr:glycoside hydrolase family 27 protein [Opitutaceae bacterium]